MEDKDIQIQLKELKQQVNNLNQSIVRKSSSARLRAEKKYFGTLTPYSIRFKPNEKELCDQLNKQEHKSVYIKELIAKDMGYMNGAHFVGCVPTKKLQEEGDTKMEIHKHNDKIDRGHLLKTLIKYTNSNTIIDSEGHIIERLFYFDNDVSNIACEALIRGALPLNAWSKDIIIGKIEDTFNCIDVPLEANGDTLTEEELKNKFLVKSFLDSPSSMIDKHIDFYRIDNNKVMKYFNINNIDLKEKFKEKANELERINSRRQSI